MALEWRPLLEGAAAATARAVARELGEAIVDDADSVEPGVDLAGGAAGLALLFVELEAAFPGEGFADEATRQLDRAGEALAAGTLPPSLFNGFTGIAWVYTLLADDSAEGAEAIDDALAAQLAESPWSGPYDVVSGLAGFAVFLHARRRHASARRALALLVDRFEELAAGEFVAADGVVDVGLAHGVPGVIAALALVDDAGVARERARALSGRLVEGLRARQLPAGGDSRYPARWSAGALEPTRSAWCYGDPGVAAALWAAGARDEALALARGVAQRPVADTRVNDAGLCHGSAGLLHLLNRLHQHSGDAALADAARDWFRRTLELRRPGEGIGGFRFFGPNIDGREGFVDDPGVLFGSAGVALALLAAAAAVEPQWDRMFLLGCAA